MIQPVRTFNKGLRSIKEEKMENQNRHFYIRNYALAYLPAGAPEWLRDIEFKPDPTLVTECWIPEGVEASFRFCEEGNWYNQFSFPYQGKKKPKSTSAIQFGQHLLGVTGHEGYIEAFAMI